jgi:hypothetical protein
MREQLAARSGQRLTITAAVIRHGTRPGWAGLRVPTICLGPVQTTGGQVLCDHLWFCIGRRLAALDLHPGDVVQLDGRVRLYKKAKLRLPGQPVQYRLEYGIAFPTKVQRLGRDRVTGQREAATA